MFTTVRKFVEAMAVREKSWLMASSSVSSCILRTHFVMSTLLDTHLYQCATKREVASCEQLERTLEQSVPSVRRCSSPPSVSKAQQLWASPRHVCRMKTGEVWTEGASSVRASTWCRVARMHLCRYGQRIAPTSTPLHMMAGLRKEISAATLSACTSSHMW